MGAKDVLLFFADGPIPPVLRAAPDFDRAATDALVARLFPGRAATALPDTSLDVIPDEDEIRAAVWPGVSMVSSLEFTAYDPSALPARFVEAGRGRTTYLHVMHSVVDLFAFAVWAPDGTLLRSFGATSDDGIVEDLGERLPFERSWWAGEHPMFDPADLPDEGDGPAHVLPFHPLEFGEAALSALFGFVYEGEPEPGQPMPWDVPIAAYRLAAPRRRLFGRGRRGGA